MSMKLEDLIIREFFFQEFRHRINYYGQEKFKKFLIRAPLIQITFTSMAFFMFSVFFLKVMKQIGETELIYASITASMLSFMTLISMFLTVEFFHAVSKIGLIKPLSYLPVKIELLPLRAWTKYYVPPLIAIMIPFYFKALLYSKITFIISIVWTLISTSIGYGLGALISTYSLRFQRKGVLADALKLILRSFMVFLVLLFIFYGIVSPEVFKEIAIINKINPHLYPVVQAITLFFSIQGIVKWEDIVAYIIFSLSVLLMGNSLVIKHLKEGVYLSELKNSFKSSFFGRFPSIVAKDLRLALRRATSIFIIILPLVLILPFLFLEETDIATWTLVVSSTAAISSLNVQILLIEEYKSGWFVFSLPITLREFRNSKAFATILLYFPILVLITFSAYLSKIEIWSFLFILGLIKNALISRFAVFWLTRYVESEYTMMPAYLTITDAIVIFLFAFFIVTLPVIIIKFTYSLVGIYGGVVSLALDFVLLFLLYKGT